MVPEDEGTEVVADETDDTEDEPTTLEEWKAKAEKLEADNKTASASLAKANRERERLKRRATEAAPTKPGQPAAKKTAANGSEEDAVSADSLARLDAATKEAQSWKTQAIRKEAEVELAAAGVDPKRVKRVARLLETEDLDFDDDGNLTGIADQIEDLKDEWPEFFGKPKAEQDEEPEKPKRPVRDRRANRDAGDKAAAGSPQKSIAEQRAERVLGLTSR